MNIIALDSKDKIQWNTFVSENFAPVGAFLESWEWGSFKQTLHGEVKRFAIVENKAWIGCFHMEIHTLPFGFSYGYAPRGPVLQKGLWSNEKKVNDVFSLITEYVAKEFPQLMFLRVEPPSNEHSALYDQPPFIKLSHYLQPRFNQLVTLFPAEELMKTFSTDIRHDIRAAERLGVTVEIKEKLTAQEQHAFEAMKTDTRNRSQRNIFPSDMYFSNFLNSFGTTQSENEPQPYLSFFVASKDGEPVAIHLNLFYADTLTYLYGATYSGSRSKRAPGNLHWKSMLHAFDHGYHYYDLGGVDDKFWHGLTYFKRQFGGQTYEYIGTYDIVLQPFYYSLYRLAKGVSNRIKGV